MLCEDGDGRDLGKINLDRPIELELIEQGVCRRGGGIAVLELEVAEPGLDRLCADPAMRISGGCVVFRLCFHFFSPLAVAPLNSPSLLPAEPTCRRQLPSSARKVAAPI